MERPALLTAARGRTHEEPVFDDHEEWPEMLDGCERKPFALDHRGANDNRFASIRTVARKL
jgi:hypothetical protein